MNIKVISRVLRTIMQGRREVINIGGGVLMIWPNFSDNFDQFFKLFRRFPKFFRRYTIFFATTKKKTKKKKNAPLTPFLVKLPYLTCYVSCPRCGSDQRFQLKFGQTFDQLLDHFDQLFGHKIIRGVLHPPPHPPYSDVPAIMWARQLSFTFSFF